MNKRYTRIGFNAVERVLPVHNLLDQQIKSYMDFFQHDVDPDKRECKGLEAILRSSFPMQDQNGRIVVEYCNYEFAHSKCCPNECIDAGLTYACNIQLRFMLKIYAIDKDTGEKTLVTTKEQLVPFVDAPMITENCSFIINGIERVAVSQIHRSPGIIFTSEDTENTAVSAKMVIYKGPWIDCEFDSKGTIKVKIDKGKKLPVSALLFSLYKGDDYVVSKDDNADALVNEGYTLPELLRIFYKTHDLKKLSNGLWVSDFNQSYFINRKLPFDLFDRDANVIIPAGRRISRGFLMKNKLQEFAIRSEDLIDKYIADDFVDEDGAIVMHAGDKIIAEKIEYLQSFDTISVLDLDTLSANFCILNALRNNDTVFDRSSAVVALHRFIKGAMPACINEAELFVYNTFFNPEYCNVSEIGRMKINARLGLTEKSSSYTSNDILYMFKYLMGLQNGEGYIDDIDSLHNRRIRHISEILDTLYRNGIGKSYRYIRDRISRVDIEQITPMELFNFKHLSNAVRDFFYSSQLCQFLDNTNPLTGLTHKRRISAFGPGGIMRERAGFEVRDVHTTHYGRICPIETPEGQNIGLISSPAIHAKYNEHGFIETPYRVVKNGYVTDEIIYCTAYDERDYTIAEFSRNIAEDGKILDEKISARHNNDYKTVEISKVDLMDTSSDQTISIAASLIPFLDNNDANRALMGSNMQRQAVPLLHSEPPLVGTGMESVVATSSTDMVMAKNAGHVALVDSSSIIISRDTKDGAMDIDIYKLKKFKRSNQSTCINQTPCVKIGDFVEKGQALSNNSGIVDGDLAIGKNVLCAFIPWYGHNFEDSIIISDRLSREDVFTSIHIEGLEVMALDTKLGPEEITRDVPGYGMGIQGNLDESGIITVGSYVNPGDILVGKVTPKGTETALIAEERLLRAMFGEKAGSVKDTSLRVPPGVQGTVIDVKVISCNDAGYRSYMIYEDSLERAKKSFNSIKGFVNRSFKKIILDKLNGTKDNAGNVVHAKMSIDELANLKFDDKKTNEFLAKTMQNRQKSIDKIDTDFTEHSARLKLGFELPTNVLKVVKVFIAIKRRLQPGDKISGRHGNKGVISKIARVADMPHLEDGTPVDVILSTLGVPSRMNIGQIFEAHLGWGVKKLGEKIANMLPQSFTESMAKEGSKDHEDFMNDRREITGLLSTAFSKKNLQEVINFSNREFFEFCKQSYAGIRIATPVFDACTDKDVDNVLKAAGQEAQIKLIDGRTGEFFDREITVGYSYLLKLDHLVDDKIHARSVGNYSLITQQPLGGRAQFGGQRFGEMEVWALQAYGAAYTLHEMITIKSDDSEGRVNAYKNIIKGNDEITSSLPESFNVLIHELRALGINIELVYEPKHPE